MDNELENINSTNDDQENLDSTNEQIESEESDEESTDEPEYTENERKLYARAKKAEEELKKLKEAKPPKENTVKKEQSGDLSTLDIIALSKANIEDEDIEEVLDYAKYKGISVREALSSSILKTTLAEKVEERKSAQVTHTGSGRRANSAISDERLLADARKGIMPENETDMSRLSMLRLKQTRK